MTSEECKAAWIANLKSRAQITAIVTPEEIREAEWQGTDFVYPNIRVSVDYRPSVNGCGPDDADIDIVVFSEQKSSKQSEHVASIIQTLYHKHPFSQNGFRFSTVWVKNIEKANRSIYAWSTEIKIFCQGI